MTIVYRRPLGMVESVFAVANALGGFRTIRATLLDRTIDAELLEKALFRVSEVFPLLRARIGRSWRGTEFVVDDVIGSLPLDVRHRINDRDWQRVSETELRRSYLPSDRLWRMVYLRSADGNGPSELLLAMHHAICDGMSGPSLIHHVLTAFADLAGGRPALAGMDQPLWPATDRMLANRSQTLRVCRFAESLLRSSVPALRPRLLDTDRVTAGSPAQRRTEIEFDRWDEPTTAEFLARCRGEKVTVHGALCAAMLAATRPLLESSDRDYSCYSNVNLRPYCVPHVDHRQFGCFVYWFQTKHHFDEETRFWDLARECGAAVKSTFQRDGFPPAIVPGTARALRFGTRLAMQQTSRNAHGGRTDSVGVSNMGIMQLQRRYGPIEVIESQAATSQHLIGVCAGMLVHSFRERMFFSLPYATGVIDRDAARRLLGRFHRGLGAAIGGNASTRVAAFDRSARIGLRA